MQDSWIERHVERLLPRAHTAALDAYFANDIDPEDASRHAVRAALREYLIAQHARPLPPEVNALLEEFEELRRLGSLPNATDLEPRRLRAIAAWNREWKPLCRGGATLPPSLAGVNLEYCDLRGIDLTNADLRRREDRGNHYGVNLADARLPGANLCGAALTSGSLERARLDDAVLDDAFLIETNLRGAQMIGTSLRGAKLTEADLTGAIVRHADMRGAELHRANFSEAEFSFVRGLLVDENAVFRTKFVNRSGLIWGVIMNVTYTLMALTKWTRSPDEQLRRPAGEDAWSLLRRIYTGPNFFVTLLLLIGFIIPYLAQAVVLSQVSRIEVSLLRGAEVLLGGGFATAPPPTAEETSALRAQLPRRYVAMRDTLAVTRRSIESARDAVRSSSAGTAAERIDTAVTSMNRAASEVRSLDEQIVAFRRDATRWLAGHVHQHRYPLWQVVLGIDSHRIGWTILVCVLFVYNGLRWFLTITVAPMRDAEERSFITPARIEYRFLVPLHRVAAMLFWVSLAAGAWSFWQWMTLPVYKLW